VAGLQLIEEVLVAGIVGGAALYLVVRLSGWPRRPPVALGRRLARGERRARDRCKH